MNLKKITAVFTSTCFLTSFVFYQPIDAAMEMHHDVQEFRQILGDFMLPATIGRITQGKYYGSSKVVINIQDLHCHPEVQRNISRAVGLLIDKYKIGNVYVEGAAGNVNTGWLADVKEKQLRKDIVETLLDQGKLTGVEYYSIIEDRPDLIKGIEDEKPYEQNIVRLGRMLERKGYYDKKTAGLNKDLGMMQKRYFNSKNLRLNEIIASYRKGNLTTEKFYRILDKYVEKINRHPDDYGNIFTINRDKYRDVWGYLELVDMGRELNYRRIAQQIQKFVGVLKQKLPYSAYNFLLQKTDNFSKLDELYVYLSRICREYKLDINGTYPDLAKFFRYIDKGQTVNPILLTKEERKLIEEIRLGLSQDSTELEISFLVDFFTYFEDYLYNRLTAEDYVYFMQQFDRFQSLWEKYAFQNHIDDMKPDFAMLNEYYKVNDARNNSFMGHLLGDFTNTAAVEPEGSQDRNIARVVDSLGRSDEIIVVVAGGFHTEGLEKLLNGRKISYVEITPNVTQDTKKSSEVYVQMAKIQAKILSSSLALKLLSTLDPQHRDWAKVSALVAARLTGKGVDIKDPGVQKKLLDLLNSSGLDLNVKELKVDGDMLKVVRQEQDRTATMTVNLKGDLVESIAEKLDMNTATRNEFYDAAIKQTAAILSQTTAPADIETPYKFLRTIGLSETVIDMFERSGMATGLIHDIYQLTKQHPDLTVDGAGIEKLYHVIPSLQEKMLAHDKKDAAVKEKLPPSLYAVDLFRDLVIAMEPFPAEQRVTLTPGTENMESDQNSEIQRRNSFLALPFLFKAFSFFSERTVALYIAPVAELPFTLPIALLKSLHLKAGDRLESWFINQHEGNAEQQARRLQGMKDIVKATQQGALGGVVTGLVIGVAYAAVFPVLPMPLLGEIMIVSMAGVATLFDALGHHFYNKENEDAFITIRS